MSGRASKNKGRIGEYLVRDAFRLYGYTAERVVGSGAHRLQNKDLDGDVVFTKNGITKRAEVKFHKGVFLRIYAMYDQYRSIYKDDRMSYVSEGFLVTMSTSLEAALEEGGLYALCNQYPFYDKFKRTLKKVDNLQKVVKNSDILVIKDNHKPLLFIRYKAL